MWTSVNPRPYSHYASRLPSRTEYTSDFSRFKFDKIQRFAALEIVQFWKFPLDPRKTPYHKGYDVRYFNPKAGVTSEEVFKNPSILPFAPSVSPAVLKRDRRFPDLCSIHGYPYGLQQRMYRINDTTACDEYGRVFVLNGAGYWEWLPLNLGGDNRGRTVIGGISKPSYYWTGIAGYDPEIQARIFNTPSIEIHHTTENTLVFAPSRLAPMPASLHRDYVHYTPRMIDYVNFFRYYRDNPWRPWSVGKTIDLYTPVNKR